MAISDLKSHTTGTATPEKAKGHEEPSDLGLIRPKIGYKEEEGSKSNGGIQEIQRSIQKSKDCNTLQIFRFEKVGSLNLLALKSSLLLYIRYYS
ncbi:hypothetical protein H5410_061835 [Solanum commersonii]|uniref:Uncharacterized protein n=1 Tax=Solanum commersonii TaxID=4109 RepID=A0A9J5W903_SOLCO|nr:hypothetical protein H5410_061835 [Solanum commersonii]